MNSSSVKNINVFSAAIQTVIADFLAMILDDLKENVVSALVYGSAAGAGYTHGVSNINIAVIVKELDLSVLKLCSKTVRWGHKKKVATPLFLTREYVLNSLDVFPIEFSDIKERHVVVFGDDFFKDLDIPLKDVRLLCEQQVKGKLLHLRQAYLEAGSGPVLLKGLLLSALRDLLPVFRQLVVIKGLKPSEQKEKMLEEFAGVYSLDADPFLTLLQDKAGKQAVMSHQLEGLLGNFLDQLQKLSRHLDSL